LEIELICRRRCSITDRAAGADFGGEGGWTDDEEEDNDDYDDDDDDEL